MRSLKLLSVMGLAFVLSSAMAGAQISATWTFDGLLPDDSPDTAAMTNVAPDVGSGILATFTSSPAEAFDVNATGDDFDNPVGVPNIAGNFLIEQVPGMSSLTIAFDVPLTAVAFDYVMATAGSMTLETSVGAAAEAAGVYLPADPSIGELWGGQMTFVSASPFSWVTLMATSPTGREQDFGIDNLTVRAVPEPGTFAFLLGGIAPLAYWLRRRNA